AAERPVGTGATERRGCLCIGGVCTSYDAALLAATSALPIRPGRAIAFRESDRADRRRADDAYCDPAQLHGGSVLAAAGQTDARVTSRGRGVVAHAAMIEPLLPPG